MRFLNRRTKSRLSRDNPGCCHCPKKVKVKISYCSRNNRLQKRGFIKKIYNSRRQNTPTTEQSIDSQTTTLRSKSYKKRKGNGITSLH